MRIDLKSALSSLPLPATTTWPEGVWDNFVPAGKHHRFVDFTPELTAWAIFWGPPGGE